MKFLKPARRLVSITRLRNFVLATTGTVARHPRFFALVLFATLVAAPVTYAQYSLDTHQKALGGSEGQNLQKFSQENFAGFINSANTALLGCTGTDCPQDLKNGALGATSNMVAGLYANPPASGVTYFADVMHRFNPVQPAYAQTTGTGFNALAPILPVWKAFRNFAYVLFAIIFVSMGLAIMFRMKLDPRTVLTIQSAIPRIVVALLLVTFSYAIAGLMIDLMYLMIALVASLFGGVQVGATQFTSTADLQNEFLTGGFWQLTGRLFTTAFGARDAGTGIGIAGIIAGALAAIPAYLVLGVALTSAVAIVGLGVGLVVLVVTIIVLYLLFKLFFELLKAYISIILSIIFGPLQITLGVIPGMPGFGSWFKSLFVNILIFPAVAFVLILGQVLIRLSGQGLWIPPMLGGTLIAGTIPFLLGLGVLMVVHQIPQIIKNAFGIKPLGFNVGEAGVVPVGAGQSTYEKYKEGRRKQAEQYRHKEIVGALGSIESKI